MTEYKIQVIRETLSYITIEVIADTLEEAEDLASEMASETEWECWVSEVKAEKYVLESEV